MNQEELQKEVLAMISKPEFIYTLIAVWLVRIIIWVLLANNIRKTLNLVAEENRLMKPNFAFGMAIPLFNIYWNFQVTKNLRDSLNNEFYDRKIAVEESPTYKKGSYYSWIYLLTNIPIGGYLTLITVLLHFVTMIYYWMDISSYKRILEEHNTFREKEEFDNKNED